MRVLLRCDAGPSTGVGHAVRCAAVAEAAELAGHEVAWSARLNGTDWLWPGLLRSGPPSPGPPGTVLPPADTAADLAALCREHRIDAVHVDHYRLGTGLRTALNAAGVALCTVEDFGTGRRPGDVVVDPNLGAQTHPRPDDGSPVLLRGPRYAPLRAAARRARARRAVRVAGTGPEPVAGPPRVLVVMGGTDAAGLLPGVVAALHAAGVAAEVDVVVPAGRAPELPSGGPARFRAVAPLPDLPAAMAAADLVVSAAGTTVWELCCVGVPMALVRAADNQAEGYRTVVAAGAAAGLGGADDLAHPDVAATTLAALLSGPGRRAALAARAATVVDGDGAARIVEAIEVAAGSRPTAVVAGPDARGSERPAGPALPAGPAGPAHPATSAAPAGPVDPADHAGPVDPATPTGSTGPAHPADPADHAGVRVRAATLDDAELLLSWRNDPDTRRWSRSTAEIDPATHRRWLAGSLGRADRRLLVVSDRDGPIGTVRWDRECTGWEVSITIAPARRGRGLAGTLLRAGEDALREWLGTGTPVTAVVHGANAASVRLFDRAGYRDGPAGPDADGFRTLYRHL